MKTKNTGKPFEAAIIQQCALYEKAGIAIIRKSDPPTRVVRIKGKPQIIYQRNPWLDFVGCYVHSGRMIQFECKHVDKPRLPIGIKTGHGVSLKQIKSMQIWNQANADIFLVWYDGKDLFVLNAGEVVKMYSEGIKSLEKSMFVKVNGYNFLQK